MHCKIALQVYSYHKHVEPTSLWHENLISFMKPKFRFSSDVSPAPDPAELDVQPAVVFFLSPLILSYITLLAKYAIFLILLLALSLSYYLLYTFNSVVRS